MADLVIIPAPDGEPWSAELTQAGGRYWDVMDGDDYPAVIFWSPVDIPADYAGTIYAGYTVWADYDERNRLAPNLYLTRRRANSWQAAIRVLLDQREANTRAVDAWRARRG